MSGGSPRLQKIPAPRKGSRKKEPEEQQQPEAQLTPRISPLMGKETQPGDLLAYLRMASHALGASMALESGRLYIDELQAALDGVARCSGVDAKRGTPRSFPLRAASRARSAAAMALVPPRPKPISAMTAPKQVPGPAPGGTRRGLLGLRAPASSISRGAPRVGVPGVPSPPRLLLAVRLPSGCTLLPRLFARNARRDWSTAHPRVSMPVPVRLGGRAYGVLPAFVPASSRSVPRLETGIVAKDARSSRCLQVRAFAVSPPGFARAHRVSPRATKRRRGHVPAATRRELWPTLAASSVGFD